MATNPNDIEKNKRLAALQPTTKKELALRSFTTQLTAGETLIVEGMPAEYGYFLLSGSVRVLRMNREGRVQVLARLGPGAPINFISLISKQKRNQSSVEAIQKSRLLVLFTSDFDDLRMQYPDFSACFLEIFADRMSRMTDLAAGLSLYTVRARLARFLMALADQSVQGDWTQDEIAAHIGTVRDVVGRLLREFEADGLIKRNRQQIFLLDREGLIRLSEDDS